jgi:hypothetical protein
VDPTTVTVTAPANNPEASLILVAWQGGRESSECGYLTLHQSLRISGGSGRNFFRAQKIH